MWNNVIGRHIQRSNRNLLVLNSVILTSLLLWAFASSRYLYNYLCGPWGMVDYDLAQVADPIVSGGGRWGHYGGTKGGHAANPRWQRVDHAEGKTTTTSVSLGCDATIHVDCNLKCNWPSTDI